MKTNNIFVDQTLYLEGKGENISEVVVKRIGKKYFYTSMGDRYPIDKETLKYENKNYSQFNMQLYMSKQEILDEREKNKLIDRIQRHFTWPSNRGKHNTLEQLRQVVEILNL